MTPWEHAARCRGAPMEWFFEDTKSNEAKAKRLCAECRVRDDCLTDALEVTVSLMRDDDAHLDAGVYGGLTVPERQALARREGHA